MTPLRKSVIVLMATAGLAACGSNQGTDQNASNDASIGADTNAAMADSANPFAAAEQRMGDAMMSAVGSNAGDSWAKKMIAHHQGAIDMSRIILEQNPKPEVAEMARQTIEKQKMDIEDIRKLQKNGSPDQKSADLYRPAMMDMQQKMQAATGADASETYMRKMLEHHRGAVAMSDIALKNGVSGALRQQVQKTRSDNQKEAEMTEAMLQGKPMQHAMKDSGSSAPAEMAAKPKSAEQANKGGPAKNTGEHSGHDMNNMGNMDMNNM